MTFTQIELVKEFLASVKPAVLIRKLLFLCGVGLLAIFFGAQGAATQQEPEHVISFKIYRAVAMIPYKGFYPGSCPRDFPIFHVSSEWETVDSDWGDTRRKF